MEQSSAPTRPDRVRSPYQSSSMNHRSSSAHLGLRFLLAAAGALTFAAAASAQAASYTLFGTNCSTGRIMTVAGATPFAAIGTPRLGTTFYIRTEGTANYPTGVRRIVFLLTGSSNQSAGPLRLPFQIGPGNSRRKACGFLYTSGEVAIRVPHVRDWRNPIDIPIAVPNSTTLLGGVFYQQVVTTESTSFGPQYGVQLSRAGKGVIGR